MFLDRWLTHTGIGYVGPPGLKRATSIGDASGCHALPFGAKGQPQASGVIRLIKQKKPFDFWVERLDLKKSRDECASFEPTGELVADYVAASLESNRFDIPLLLRATRCAVT